MNPIPLKSDNIFFILYMINFDLKKMSSEMNLLRPIFLAYII